jgi:hypothetical protein
MWGMPGEHSILSSSKVANRCEFDAFTVPVALVAQP